MIVNSSIYWYITPCSPLKVNRIFGGTCRLHLQVRRISQERNQLEIRRKKLLPNWFIKKAHNREDNCFI
jgi:hypothetical protein